MRELQEAPLVFRCLANYASPGQTLRDLWKGELETAMLASENEMEQHQSDESYAKLRCDFCGASLDQTVSNRRKERGRFCSKNCQRRAARGRTAVRLGNPPSRRMEKKLRYSDPLYFS